jgi:hypothetical protein
LRVPGASTVELEEEVFELLAATLRQLYPESSATVLPPR